jgi:hypothetical protein
MWGIHFRATRWDRRGFYTGLDPAAGKEVFETQRYGVIERQFRRIPNTFSLVELYTGIIPIGALPDQQFVTTEQGTNPFTDETARINPGILRECSLSEIVQYAMLAAPQNRVVAQLRPLQPGTPAFHWAVQHAGVAQPQFCTFYGVDNMSTCENPDPRFVQRALSQSWHH